MTNARGQNVRVGSVIAWGPLVQRLGPGGEAHMVSQYMGVVEKLTTGLRPKATILTGNGARKGITLHAIKTCRIISQDEYNGYVSKGLV